MGRPKDAEFWDHVEKTSDGLMCKFCWKQLKGDPSISRIKSHLSGIQGRGIQICSKVPGDIKAAAREAIQRRNKKRKTMPNSSFNNEVDDPISWPQCQGLDNQFGDFDFIQMEVQDTEEEAGQGGTLSLSNMTNHTQNHAGQAVQPVKTTGDELLTTESVGENFELHIQEIWTWLMDDNVSRIGIYGMRGVGKTELAKRINNQLLKIPNTFHHVYWVSVSPDFSVHKLQSTIARVVNLDLSSVDNEQQIRAARLFEALSKNKKSVLILDDVWNYIPLKKVGIPVSMDGCKLVLTTPSLDVCQKMSFQKNVKVELLSNDESFEFFMRELRREAVPEGVEEIAKSIADKCEGLPFGIELMARNMRGVDDICEWRDTLNRIEEGILTQEKLEIFHRLSLSYDYLNDSALQQCFLYCALYTYDYKIRREELIDNLIGEGIIEEMDSRQAEFDRGHSMLNRLEKVCLLEGFNVFNNDDKNYREVEMHILLRDMAIQMMKVNPPRAMVQSGKKLREMPSLEKWPEDLVRCSLVNNWIEIPFGYSPRCPNLITLLLGGNRYLRSIPASLFEKMNGLKVLDLSRTGIEELPGSISHCVNLTVLLLRQCELLRKVQSLSELRSLKKLDLNYSWKLEEVPQGIEMLFNLRYLNLNGTYIEELPIGILPKLTYLQVLKLSFSFTVKGEEVASLMKLECLSCRFNDIGEWNTYLASKRAINLSQYYCVVAGSAGTYPDMSKDGKEVCFGDCKIEKEEDAIFLPEDLQRIVIDHVEGLSCLLSRRRDGRASLSSPTIIPFSLREFIIKECPSMRKLFPVGFLSNLHNLELIRVEDCKNMEELIAMEEIEEINVSIQFTFPKLRIFDLGGCPSMKKLFPVGLLSNLHNLEEIDVSDCENMEDLIAMEEIEESNVSIQFTLPKLRNFRLSGCPSMKKLFPAGLLSNLHNLELIRVEDCKNMEELIAMEEIEEINVSIQFTLPQLRIFRLSGCPSMKKLFPAGLLSNLHNLEEIYVSNCENMEELIAMEEIEESNVSIQFILPNLRTFYLNDLPKLKSICSSGKLICNSLHVLTVKHCWKLKKMPFSLILLDDNGQPLQHLPSLEWIFVYPREWWNSVELEHPNAKNLLERFVLRF